MKELLKKVNVWKEKGYINLFEVIGVSILFIIVYCLSFSESIIDIENKVVNNFCNYVVEKDLISVEKYVEKYETDYEKESFIASYDEKDLCVAIYIRYITEVVK